MQATAPSYELDVERGPDWLLVRLGRLDPSDPDALPLADYLWSLLQQHFTYRLVLELDRGQLLNSSLIGQLMHLFRQIEEHDGVMRLCGLSPYNREVLHACHLDDRFLPYEDRREAVMGCHQLRRPR
jgi:anti-anti-sigma regulatory factor